VKVEMQINLLLLKCKVACGYIIYYYPPVLHISVRWQNLCFMNDSGMNE